jgi:hypothetical protein
MPDVLIKCSDKLNLVHQHRYLNIQNMWVNQYLTCVIWKIFKKGDMGKGLGFRWPKLTHVSQLKFRV